MTWLAKFNFRNLFSPNGLSVLRGILGCSIPFFLMRPETNWHEAALVLFIVGAITDYFDGAIAREKKLVSFLGKILDPSMDKILILAPWAWFSTAGYLSPWFLVPIFIREIAVTFCRIAWYLDGAAVGAEKMGKLKFFFQTLCVFSLFAYDLKVKNSILLSWATYDAIRILFFLFLFISLILTISSGISFFMNNRQHLKTESFAKFFLAAGVGLSPVSPGTLGSLVGVLIAFLCSWNIWLYGTVFLALFLLSCRAAGYCNFKKVKDPQFIVQDEVIGIGITFLLWPMNFHVLLTGFLLFRLFDILKPFPVRLFERLPGVWGVMLDDVAAGIYSWFGLWLLLRAQIL